MLDTSVYKILAHNDTGQARGHQAGIVIPAAIAQFFPPLASVATAGSPTVDTTLTADLFVNGRRVETVQTRYQHQTWGGTRSPERRLTDNLGALRNQAVKDDIVLFTKGLEDDGYIQIHLVKQGTEEYRAILASVGSARWGPLDPDDRPVSVTEIDEAESYVNSEAAEPPKAFDDDRGTVG